MTMRLIVNPAKPKNKVGHHCLIFFPVVFRTVFGTELAPYSPTELPTDLPTCPPFRLSDRPRLAPHPA